MTVNVDFLSFNTLAVWLSWTLPLSTHQLLGSWFILTVFQTIYMIHLLKRKTCCYLQNMQTYDLGI